MDYTYRERHGEALYRFKACPREGGGRHEAQRLLPPQPRIGVRGRLGLFVVRHALQDLRQDLARLGKCRLAVRILRAPHHGVDTATLTLPRKQAGEGTVG